jgi:hypothetical protein
MAFALTKFEARSIDIASVTYKRGIQQVVLDITGTTADVDLDIGDYSGTFWTAAVANATYGTLASNSLTVLQQIVAQAAALVEVSSQQLLDRVQVASLTTSGQFSLAIQNTLPNLEFNAADGETAYKIILTFELNNYIFPIVAQYGQS